MPPETPRLPNSPDIKPPVKPSVQTPTAPTNDPSFQPTPVPRPTQNPVPTVNNFPSEPSPLQSSKGNEAKKEGIKNIIYTVLLFILAPLFALVMILFVFQSYVVDGSSMEPTLQNGNRVFILKLPKTIANAQNKTFIPTRHEIIVFKKPSDPGVQLIKRVIGLPGDRVVVKNNKITIYNQENPKGFDVDANTDYGSSLDPSTGDVDIIVGANELFVSGDNRAPGGSLDSRSGLGLVPVDNIIGRLWVRYYPLSEVKLYSYLKQVFVN
jgi:signal peptidase I